MNPSALEFASALDGLSVAEKEKIEFILGRNNSLRRRDRIRIMRLKKQKEISSSSVSLNQKITKSCPQCNGLFALLLSGNSCTCCVCSVKVCKKCTIHFQKNNVFMCLLCYDNIVFEAKSGEWFRGTLQERVIQSLQNAKLGQEDNILDGILEIIREPMPIEENIKKEKLKTTGNASGKLRRKMVKLEHSRLAYETDESADDDSTDKRKLPDAYKTEYDHNLFKKKHSKQQKTSNHQPTDKIDGDNLTSHHDITKTNYSSRPESVAEALFQTKTHLLTSEKFSPEIVNESPLLNNHYNDPINKYFDSDKKLVMAMQENFDNKVMPLVNINQPDAQCTASEIDINYYRRGSNAQGNQSPHSLLAVSEDDDSGIEKSDINSIAMRSHNSSESRNSPWIFRTICDIDYTSEKPIANVNIFNKDETLLLPNMQIKTRTKKEVGSRCRLRRSRGFREQNNSRIQNVLKKIGNSNISKCQVCFHEDLSTWFESTTVSINNVESSNGQFNFANNNTQKLFSPAISGMSLSLVGVCVNKDKTNPNQRTRESLKDIPEVCDIRENMAAMTIEHFQPPYDSEESEIMSPDSGRNSDIVESSDIEFENINDTTSKYENSASHLYKCHRADETAKRNAIIRVIKNKTISDMYNDKNNIPQFSTNRSIQEVWLTDETETDNEKEKVNELMFNVAADKSKVKQWKFKSPHTAKHKITASIDSTNNELHKDTKTKTYAKNVKADTSWNTNSKQADKSATLLAHNSSIMSIKAAPSNSHEKYPKLNRNKASYNDNYNSVSESEFEIDTKHQHKKNNSASLSRESSFSHEDNFKFQRAHQTSRRESVIRVIHDKIRSQISLERGDSFSSGISVPNLGTEKIQEVWNSDTEYAMSSDEKFLNEEISDVENVFEISDNEELFEKAIDTTDLLLQIMRNKMIDKNSAYIKDDSTLSTYESDSRTSSLIQPIKKHFTNENTKEVNTSRTAPGFKYYSLPYRKGVSITQMSMHPDPYSYSHLQETDQNHKTAIFQFPSVSSGSNSRRSSTSSTASTVCNIEDINKNRKLDQECLLTDDIKSDDETTMINRALKNHESTSTNKTLSPTASFNKVLLSQKLSPPVNKFATICVVRPSTEEPHNHEVYSHFGSAHDSVFSPIPICESESYYTDSESSYCEEADVNSLSFNNEIQSDNYLKPTVYQHYLRNKSKYNDSDTASTSVSCDSGVASARSDFSGGTKFKFPSISSMWKQSKSESNTKL